MSVILRTEICPGDLTAMMRWMANPHVYRYMNEHRRITERLRQVYDARLPVLTPLFNQGGRFLMICGRDERPVGFLRMAYCPGNEVEMVIAIGEEQMWGRGIGRESVRIALKMAFLDMRREAVIVHIHHDNIRSRNLFENSGFTVSAEGSGMTQYRLTFDDYLHPERREENRIA